MQNDHGHRLIGKPTAASTVIRGIALGAWLASGSGHVSSQPASSSSPSERSEPHEALGFYEGTWTILSSKREDFRETCSWLAEGRRHIVCRARYQAAEGPREALGVYSYDPTQGEYLYHGFGARGGVSKERGQRIAKGFHFTSERGTGADRVRVRFTIEEAGQGRVNTVSEKSKADGPWVVEETVEYLRTRP